MDCEAAVLADNDGEKVRGLDWELEERWWVAWRFCLYL